MIQAVNYHETPWGKEPYCPHCGSDVYWHECPDCDPDFPGFIKDNLKWDGPQEFPKVQKP